ncbi:TPA: Rrf2 family transcriptional regulator [Clostridioides difficile]|nr:Rrf2 family transcriptional regulator [Clostridioides difficile]
MQLKLSTDYAIRIVLYLAMKNNAVSVNELSEKLGIDQQYILKFCKKLKDAEIVNIHDYNNEISLSKSPNQVTMFDIINTMENTTKINLCLEEDEYCSRFATDTCPVRRFYCELQSSMETSLKKTTIQELLE